MYVSRILVEGSNKELVRQLKELFNELGYFIVEKEPDVIISVGSIYKTLNKYYTKYKDVIIINVTEDGNNVIPISRELSGGSFIGGIIADSLGANLILTSPTSIRGLYSIQEFSWLNGFSIPKKHNKLLNYINHKLIKNGIVNVYSEILGLKYVLYDGYNNVKSKEEADVIISNDNNLSNSQQLILNPLRIYLGIKYVPSTPFEVLVYSVKMTLKSLYLVSNRIDYIVIPSKYDDSIKDLSRYYLSNIIHLQEDIETSCQDLLRQIDVRVVLKETRRAFGVLTCLGVR